MKADEIYKIVGAPIDGRYPCPLCEQRSLLFVFSDKGVALFTCITGCAPKQIETALRVTSFIDDSRQTHWNKSGTVSVGNENNGWTVVDNPADVSAYEEREREARYGYERETDEREV